jgi:ABC-2 type transport system ATP-binding protein
MFTSAVRVTGLTKRYGRRTAVDRLDIDLPTGVVAGFIGPNGAGKTTTMAMLLGLVRPTSGSGWVLGEPLDDPASYLPRVGALVESPAFYPSLSGAENLALFAKVAAKDAAAIEPVLATVGLSDRAGDRYRTYSLGMKQRLGIAAALIGDPELLILDEPANGLDPQGVRDIRGLVGSLTGTGRTVLVSSHDLSELEQICDWLVLIDGGRSLYQGPTRGLLDGAVRGIAVAPERAADGDGLRLLLKCHGFELEPGDGIVVPVDGHDAAALAASINRVAFDAGIVLAELTHRRTTLEDRYLAMAEGSR